MSKWSTMPLKGHIREVSQRKGDAQAEILSVTNSEGFVRSLDMFDKRVFSEDSSSYKLVKHNDIVYNPSRINVGSVAVCQFDEGGAVSPMYIVVRCRESLLPQYLLYYLKSEVGRLHVAHRCVGAVRFQLRYTDLEELELPIPPLDVQERIVLILDEADQLRRLRVKVDRSTNDLIPSLFQDTFGVSSPVVDSSNGPFLKDVCRVVTGNTPPRGEEGLYGDFVEWVKTDDIDVDRGYVRSAKEKLSRTGAVRGRIVQRGSVLVTCIAGSLERIGDAAIVDREVAINQQINALVPNEDVESTFLWQLVQSLKKLIQSRATGVMTRIITKSGLECIPVVLQSAELQREFAQRATEIRSMQDKQVASRQCLDDLFQSLLHRAFKGEL
jgi:type I restriction enzyme S subunit